jgi:CelD/BcsL family acetyltransferase involved in cellulose biosynthesis
VRVSLIHPRELGRSEIAVWHSMQRAIPSLANPFLSPEFAMAVGRFRPAAQVAVLTEGQSIVGFFPFERRRLGAGVPICGWITPFQGVIHAPGAEWDPQELLRGCHISAWRFDNLIADQKPFMAYHSSIVASSVIDLSDGFEAYHAKLQAKSSRFCRELARRARKLEREFGELRIMADSRDASVLHTLMDWKSERYRQTNHVDRFAQHWLVELLDTLLATRSAQFNGLLSALYAGDQLVAAQFGLRTEALLVGWFTGYEASFGKYSPGLIHIKRLAEEMAAAGVGTIDMGGGAKNYYKETMKSYDNFVAQGVVTSRSMLGAAHHVRSALTRSARRPLRRHQGLHSAADQILCRTGLARRIWGRI